MLFLLRLHFRVIALQLGQHPLRFRFQIGNALGTLLGVNLRSSRIVGNGLLARRSSAVLPPPSRLCCASASAWVGLDFDLLLTNTTCSGCMKFATLRGLGITRAMPNKMKACNSIEKTIEKDNLVRNTAENAAPHVFCLALNGVLYRCDKARLQTHIQ